MYEIAAVRTQRSDDQTHEHVALVGYNSPHIEGEQIWIPVARILQRQALGDTFAIRIDDEMVDVAGASCEICGFGPILKPTKGSLLDLPRK